MPTTSAPAVRASVRNSLSESSTLHKLSLSSCSTATRKACSGLPREVVSLRRGCFTVSSFPAFLNVFYCHIDIILTLEYENASPNQFMVLPHLGGWLPRTPTRGPTPLHTTPVPTAFHGHPQASHGHPQGAPHLTTPPLSLRPLIGGRSQVHKNLYHQLKCGIVGNSLIKKLLTFAKRLLCTA